jgi:uncharacterized membrane protein (DUF4010 family)
MPELPEVHVLFQRFAIALALGLFIGFEREMEKAGSFAGIRTFPLISMLGCTAALLHDLSVAWAFPVILVILAAFVLAAYFYTSSAASPGITTEITSLLAFLFGALVWWQMPGLAAALAVVTVLLLASKKPLEDLAHRIGQSDLNAALQFAVITLVILPVVPDRTFGPLDVINFHDIWLFVILIAGLNLIGYILIKILGSHQGIGLSGLLGGIGSSTALTVSFSRRSKAEAYLGADFAFGIVLASSIMFIRVLVLVLSINPQLGARLLAPVAVTGMTGFLGCAYLWFSQLKREERGEGKAALEISNPLELWQAIRFGILFGIIIIIARAAQFFFGTAGVYVSSFLTGLTDVDAITLSLSKLEQGALVPAVAVHGIMIATLANTAVKALITAVNGSAGLRRQAVPVFSAMIGAGILALLFL